MTKTSTLDSLQNLSKVMMGAVRHHRTIGTPIDELREALYIFAAGWLATDQGIRLYDIDQYIAENREILDAVVEVALLLRKAPQSWGAE